VSGIIVGETDLQLTLRMAVQPDVLINTADVQSRDTPAFSTRSRIAR
jgi:hypothetical protein